MTTWTTCDDPEVSVPELTRDSTGLLFNLQADEGTFDANDWSESGGLVVFAVQPDGALSVDHQDGNIRYCQYDPSSDIATRYVQMVMVMRNDPPNNQQMGPIPKLELDIVSAHISFQRSVDELVIAREAGIGTTSNATTTKSKDIKYRVSGFHDNTEAIIYAYDFDGDVGAQRSTSATGNGQSGFLVNNGVDGDVYEWMSMTDRKLTVNGVSVDQKIQLLDSGGNVLKTETVTGDPQTVDVFEVVLPATTIRVLNEFDQVLASLGPTSGVWGGDSYTFSQTAGGTVWFSC